ncbi:MAG: hypothetical protein QXX72_02115 [Desulfurococcaceae archaeon]
MRAKYRGWIPLGTLVVVSFTVGALLRIAGVPVFYGYPVVLLLLVATYLHSYMFDFFASLSEKVSMGRILYTGRAPSPRFSALYAVVVQVASYLALVFATIGIVYYFAYGFIPLWLPLIAFVIALLLAATSVLPMLQVKFTVASRKTGAEIELPFLLLMVKVLSSTHLTFYDILKAVEKSLVLKSWSNEIRSAVRYASVLGTSLITAMSAIAEKHPSSTVRDIFRRMITVAVSVGTVKEVADKAFGQVYAKLEARLSGLVEKLTIINGVLMFVYLFIPILLVIVAPLYGGDLLTVLVLPLAFFTLFFFVVYAVTSSIYPSAFEITPPRILLYLGLSVYAVVATLAIATGAYIVATKDTSFMVLTLSVIPLLLVAPVTTYSELWLRKARTYDKFIRMTLDAATVSASLGENLLSVMERLAPQYGRDVENITRKVVLAQTSDYLKADLIRDAPSLFHAAFVEVLLYSLSLGAKPEMIKELAASYEHLINVYSKLNSVSRTQELMVLGLVGMLSWFIGYIRGLFSQYLDLVRKASVQGAWSVNVEAYIRFNPLTYDVLWCVVILALLFLSIIVGKMRGGSPLYGFRTMLVLLAILSTSLVLSQVVAPGIVP